MVKLLSRELTLVIRSAYVVPTATRTPPRKAAHLFFWPAGLLLQILTHFLPALTQSFLSCMDDNSTHIISLNEYIFHLGLRNGCLMWLDKIQYTGIKRQKCTVHLNNKARWRSGNATVCKTVMRQFNSGTRLKISCKHEIWRLANGH